MTVRELISILSAYPVRVAVFLTVPPIGALVIRAVSGPNGGFRSPWRRFYSFLVFLACIPGMLAAVLTGYAVFFTRENLPDRDLLVYLLPILSMALTLILIGRFARLTTLPGFGRLSGLMTSLAAVFAILLILDRTRIWLFFGGSIWIFLLAVAALYLILRWSVRRMFGPPERSGGKRK